MSPFLWFSPTWKTTGKPWLLQGCISLRAAGIGAEIATQRSLSVDEAMTSELVMELEPFAVAVGS